VIVGLRPQDFEDSSIASDSPKDCRLKATPELVEGIGTETLIHFVIDAPLPLTDEVRELAADVGGEVVAQLERRAGEGHNLFVARLDPRTEASQGKTMELTIDTGRLHFFDPESGLNILDRNL
jgi:multiple sugar transport system ATP-binding protein